MKFSRWSWLLFLSIGLAACVSTPPEPTMAPRPSETRIPTFTPTPLPTFTPTPTATARPLALSDDLRAQRSVAPTPQRGAPCGVVDFFDFPLDAPDGQNAQAPWPFGYYSERYSGIHAGEDWIYTDGASLGRPVYSIGHGTVLYAQPLGWGVDQGTIIVRHVFTNGRSILSFYGHLEPESVSLKPGACVTRDQQIGLIGQPRTRPHLHFEIRSLYPGKPGPGYWSVDPRLAGWQPPTEYIWDQRVATSPGVKWTRPFTTSASLLVGLLVSDMVVAVDRNQLLALDSETGRVQWSHPISDSVQQAVVDDTRALIYLTTTGNTLQAIDASGTLRWQTPLSATRAILLPLPGGGVMAHDDHDLLGFSLAGQPLWRFQKFSPPIAWLRNKDDLIFTTGGDRPGLYRIDQAGHANLIALFNGQLAASAADLFVYAPTALYRLRERPEVLKLLDRTGVGQGSLVATSDGGVILSHNGTAGRRLISLEPDGTLRWDRSIRELTGSAPQLVSVKDEVYAVTPEGDVWRIDQRQGEAQRVLDGARLMMLRGGIRSFVTSAGTLLVDFRGGRLVAFDPQAVPPISD